MSSVVISGDTSGTITVAAPAVAGSNTQTLVAATGTLAPLISGTAQASTSGTSIDFTSIPSWVKRITVMFSSVSTNGTAYPRIQLGSGGTPATTGYLSTSSALSTSVASLGSTSGFDLYANLASYTICGTLTFTLITGNTWTASGSFIYGTVAGTMTSAGAVTLGGTCNIVRITTSNGTDTFDAGSINILYE